MADGVDGRETLMERIPTLHQNEKYRHKVFRIQQRIRCTIGTIIDIITLRQERIITRIRPAWEEPGMTGRQYLFRSCCLPCCRRQEFCFWTLVLSINTECTGKLSYGMALSRCVKRIYILLVTLERLDSMEHNGSKRKRYQQSGNTNHLPLSCQNGGRRG